MTAPDPPAEASVVPDAVEAAARSLYEGVCDDKWGDLKADDFDHGFYTDWAAETLAAALPHLHAQWMAERPRWREHRAQVLAEVDAALRDQGRYLEWYGRNLHLPATLGSLGDAADYLRDTLTPEEDR